MNQLDMTAALPSDRPWTDTSSSDGRGTTVSSRACVLLVDDDPAVARAIEIALRLAGHSLDRAANPQEAFSCLARRRYDAILLDLNFGPGAANGDTGLACLRRIVSQDPTARVLVITAHGGVRIAVTAMQAGARDFIAKPWRNADLIAKLEAVFGTPPPRAPAAPVVSGDVHAPALLLGESKAMIRLRDLVRRIGPTNASVTITGPAGSGRMLTAFAIHAASLDAATPLVRIDLRNTAPWPTLPDRGTLVLRYPDHLDPVVQDRLLDCLAPPVRCLAIADRPSALNPALRRRIATLDIAVPSLSDRGDDVALLARHFALAAADRFGRPAPRWTAAAETMVRSTSWTDEVRGLALAIERGVLLAEDGVIDVAVLTPPAPWTAAPTTSSAPAGRALADAEKAVIAAALRDHGHNITDAAAALGLSRGTLYRRMARYGL